MNIDWMTFKIEWKSKSAKIKRLLLRPLRMTLITIMWNIFIRTVNIGSRAAPTRGINIRVTECKLAVKRKYIQDYSCVPVVDATRLYRKIQLMSVKYGKEKKKNEQQ